MKRKTLLVIGLVALFALPGWAGLFSPKENATPPMHNLIKELNLSKDQVAQCEMHRTSMEKEQIQLRAKLQSLHLDLKTELRKETVDEAKISGIIAEIGKLNGDILRNHVSNLLKLKSVLTSEQKEKLLSKGMFDGGMGDGMMMRPDGNAPRGREGGRGMR